MNVSAIESNSDQAPPSFGLLLSLLAIGLALTVVRGVSGLLMAFRADALPGARAEGLVNVGIAVFALIALKLLLGRRRRFIPVMIAFLVVNLVLGIGLVGTKVAYIAAGGVSQLDLRVAALALGVQVVVSALWLAYLTRSQHVRKVCTQ